MRWTDKDFTLSASSPPSTRGNFGAAVIGRMFLNHRVKRECAKVCCGIVSWLGERRQDWEGFIWQESAVVGVCVCVQLLRFHTHTHT